VASPGAYSRTLLNVPWVPAGRYRIHVQPEPGSDGDTTLSLEVGRDAWPLWTWRASRVAEASESALVMPVHSVSVRGEARSPRAATVLLQPGRQLGKPEPRSVAERVTRYGRWLVYSLDRYSYMERGGFWCAGDRVSRVVVADVNGARDSYVLALEAGPAPVRAPITSVKAHHDVRLSAGERARLQMPADPEVAPVSLDRRRQLPGGRRVPRSIGQPHAGAVGIDRDALTGFVTSVLPRVARSSRRAHQVACASVPQPSADPARLHIADEQYARGVHDDVNSVRTTADIAAVESEASLLANSSAAAFDSCPPGA
jgi:hypothetical protein